MFIILRVGIIDKDREYKIEVYSLVFRDNDGYYFNYKSYAFIVKY